MSRFLTALQTAGLLFLIVAMPVTAMAQGAGPDGSRPQTAFQHPRFDFEVRQFPSGHPQINQEGEIAPLVAVAFHIAPGEIPPGTEELELAVVLSDEDRQVGADRWFVPIASLDRPFQAQVWMRAALGELDAQLTVKALPGQIQSSLRVPIQVAGSQEHPLGLSSLWLTRPDDGTESLAALSAVRLSEASPTELIYPAQRLVRNLRPDDRAHIRGTLSFTARDRNIDRTNEASPTVQWELRQEDRVLDNGEFTVDATTLTNFEIAPDWAQLGYGPATMTVRAVYDGKSTAPQRLRVFGGTRCLRADANPDLVKQLLNILVGSPSAERIVDSDDPQSRWDAFWAQRDPSPGTEHNEFREAVQERLDIAAEKYADFSRLGRGGRLGIDRPGWLTDRGRVFIKYGPPDAIDDSFVDVDIRPAVPSIANFETWIYERGDRSFIFIDYGDTGNYRLFTGDLKKSATDEQTPLLDPPHERQHPIDPANKDSNSPRTE